MSQQHQDPTALTTTTTTKSAPAMTADDKAMFRRVTQVVERLQGVKAEIASLHRRVAVAEVEKSDFSTKVEASAQSKDKLLVLYDALTKRNEQLREQLRGQSVEEKEKRERLSQELNKNIADITARMDRDTAERTAILVENERLKSELKEHEAQIENFVTTFEQQFKTLDTEGRMLQLKINILAERCEKDEAALPELEATSKVCKEKDEQLRAIVTEYADQFDEIQKDLTGTNGAFQKNRAEIERMSKRFKVLEAERADALKKAEKAQVQLAQARAEKEDAEKQLKAIETGAATLDNLCNTLKEEIAAIS
eukprot:PhM_4_TR13346/c6_g3_i1/m.69109